MNALGLLARIEAIVERAAVAETIEGRLPVGVRPRQLTVHTLLVGMLLAIADDRPAHLVRAHRALLALPEGDRRRLGVVVRTRRGPHLLTYRQVEYTARLVVAALAKPTPDGAPSEDLQRVVDALVEASIPAEVASASSSLAVDWTDQETFARPPVAPGGLGADPEAAWGHRRGGPHKGELFFGYYFQAATMVRDETGPAVPELVRRMAVSSCALDPVPLLVPVLARLGALTALGDVLCDSGYAHRTPEHWALPIRDMGAALIMDLHPSDRGTKGTYQGAICHNGSLYCPSTPKALLGLEPLGRQAGPAEIAAHDRRAAELARYRLGAVTSTDSDGYHRAMCPAALGKVRCPAKPASLTLAFDRPEVATPPDDLPACCAQSTITVPPEVNAKTAQKHPYPSAAHRRSYARRTAVERSYSTMKDPASTDTTRGWCRLMGLVANTLLLSCAVVVRNLRVLDAFEERQLDDDRRRQAGMPARTRRRRRRSIDDLLAPSAVG